MIAPVKSTQTPSTLGSRLVETVFLPTTPPYMLTFWQRPLRVLRRCSESPELEEAEEPPPLTEELLPPSQKSRRKRRLMPSKEEWICSAEVPEEETTKCLGIPLLSY